MFYESVLFGNGVHGKRANASAFVYGWPIGGSLFARGKGLDVVGEGNDDQNVRGAVLPVDALRNLERPTEDKATMAPRKSFPMPAYRTGLMQTSPAARMNRRSGTRSPEKSEDVCFPDVQCRLPRARGSGPEEEPDWQDHVVSPHQIAQFRNILSE
ncbi:MAG: hypothetical protein VB067_09115 [Christensenellaceae bacterium]|nr:hypothetical protein [Eubacteriales bacterium]MEA5069133.1 hypothetical protein [Christensenellaceae bacterium]